MTYESETTRCLVYGNVPQPTDGGAHGSAAGSIFLMSRFSYESVTYLAECGITAGKGGHSFSPERPITVREWAALLFRAFDGSTLSCDSPKERSELGIQRCYQNGWLGVSAAISPDGTLCRGELLLSAFHTAGLPVYNASLYGYEEAGCLRRKTRYALERNLDCAPKRPHHLECSCFRLSIEKSFNRRSMEEKTAAGCSIRAVLWHKSVGSTDSRSGRACNKPGVISNYDLFGAIKILEAPSAI